MKDVTKFLRGEETTCKWLFFQGGKAPQFESFNKETEVVRGSP
jgi:hypothetical protein